jgi:hypothetical protein
MDEFMKLMIRSVNEELTPEEQEKLEITLNRNPDLGIEQRELQRLRNNIADARSDCFNPQFPASVIFAITRLESKSKNAFEELLFAFYRVGLAGALACLMLAMWTQATSKNSVSPPSGSIEMVEELVELSTYYALEEVL